jgi:putative ABC transport system ATP-binding protein
MKPLILLEHISKSYLSGDNQVKALNDISLEIYPGEFISIIGSSGSGKSTLMNILGCLDLPSEGSYFLDGINPNTLSDQELSKIRNQKIGFIFQSFNLIPSLTAAENVELQLAYGGIEKKYRRKLALSALQRVGLSSRVKHRPNQMSGGQQQRVAIARAIAAAPPILFADEPTGNLDSHSSKEIMDILKQLHREGRTVILITHDPQIASQTQKRICIQDGQIISQYS